MRPGVVGRGRRVNDDTFSLAELTRMQEATRSDISVIRGRSIRNPLTNRILRLPTPQSVNSFLAKSTERVQAAMEMHKGADGYQFKKVKENGRLAIYEYRLPYNVSVMRASIDIDRMVGDFYAKSGLPNDTEVRLSAQLSENGNWVSERFMTTDELTSLDRPLFTGDFGTNYSELSDLSVLQITAYKSPTGAACTSPQDLPHYLQNKQKSIAYIFNDGDDMCGQRALVWSMEPNVVKRRNYLATDKPYRAVTFKKDAEALSEIIGTNGAMGYDDFKTFTEKFEDWGVVVFSSLETVMWHIETKRPHIAYLIWHPTDDGKGHYHAVREPDHFDVAMTYCRDCLKFIPRKNINFHLCDAHPYRCSHCNMRFATDEALQAHKSQWSPEERIVCEKCNHWAFGPDCAEQHQCDGKTKLCLVCKRNYRPSEPHICWTDKCKCCNEFVNLKKHRCFIQKIKPPRASGTTFWVYDFETDIVQFDHHVAIAVAFWNISDENAEIQYYHGYDTMQRFVQFVLSTKKTTWIAHNAKGYDLPLLKEELEKQHGYFADVITAGTKIMRLSLKRTSIVFLDSLNHFGCGLASLPDMFKLKETLRKGYFPYKQPYGAYVGMLPPQESFCMRNRPRKEHVAFLHWYAERCYEPWDHLYEMEQYCRNDVLILGAALKKYMVEGEALTTLNPMRYTTIASFAMNTYLLNDMPPRTIAVLNEAEQRVARAALYGGRTDISNTLVELSDEQLLQGHHIRYLDYVSLYPSVQWESPMPSAHAKIRKGIFSNCDRVILEASVCGFAEVDVTIAKTHIHPILPDRSEGIVNFTCLDKVKTCYSLVELQEAVRSGDHVTRIYEIHEYEPRCDLWQAYVKRFYRGKLTNGGALKPQSAEKYVEECRERYGMPDLQVSEFVSNPGKKAVSKLLLNSLWGKFGQRNQARSEVVDHRRLDVLMKLRKQKAVDIKNQEIVDENHTRVTYVDNRESENNSYKVNIAVAAYVTAHARLKLLSAMRLVGDRLIGNDTDSIWATFAPTDPTIPVSKHLGDLEDEKPHHVITHATATGRKSYAMKMIPRDTEVCDFPQAMDRRLLTMHLILEKALVGPPQELAPIYELIMAYLYKDVRCVKSKGVILGFENGQKVTYESMKYIQERPKRVIDNLRGPVIKRQKTTPGNVVLKSCRDNEHLKILRFTATKRRLPLPEFKHLYAAGFRLPLGHVHASPDQMFV